MPLYKKTGFFWQPETTVHMLNFLPLILPLAPDFFADADWYTTYQRELAQKEDDIEWRGMKVYPYTFQKDGRLLKVIIDRESRGVTAYETESFSVACLLETQELIAGVASPVRWEITNRKQTPLNVSLLANGEAGLSLYKKTTLQVQDSAVIEGEVLVDRDISTRDEEEPAHKIISTLVVDGQVIVLESGVRPKQAVEISAEPSYISLPLGMPQTVHLRLRSNLKQPARATVGLVPPAGVTIDRMQHSVDLPAGGHAGITCTMQASQAGTPDILAAITVETDKGNIAVKPVRLPVAAPGAGKPSAYMRPDEAVLENESTRLRITLKGAQLIVASKEPDHSLLYQRSSLGPPFYPSEFRGKRFSCRLEEADGTVTAVLSAASERHPGVIFERRVTLDSSPVATLGYCLYNTGGKEHHFNIQSGHWGSAGKISIAVPTHEGVVVDQVPGFPDWSDEESSKPASMAETWVASSHGDTVLGVIWHEAEKQEFDTWTAPNLTLPCPPLPAYGRCEAQPEYIYAGPGDWRSVRRAWRRLVKPGAPAREPQSRTALAAATVPSPLVLLDGKATTILHLDNQRSRPLAGTVSISVPAGWTVSPAQAEFKGLRRTQPSDLSLTVQRARGKGAAMAEGSATVRHEFCTGAVRPAYTSIGPARRRCA